jgi:5-methylcytosine-specific restriction endonuclease McrA
MKKKNKSIRDLLIGYFKAHPKEDMPHGPVVDWVEEQYLQLYNKKPRDTWRSIRRLYQDGHLIKVKKGVYRYNPKNIRKIKILDFSSQVKQAALERDKYKCIVCGRGRKDGVELCVDHRIPLDKGGTNTLDNAQTLCMEHNLLKKNYSQTEFGKRFLIKIYKQAVKNKDKRMTNFCKCIFECYDKHKINGHIPRPNHKK